MEKMFSLPRDVIALSGITSKNTSRVELHAVHFDGKNAMAADGHRMAIIPLDNPELAGVSLNLGEMKRPKAAFVTFIKTGETRFLSDAGAADVAECAQPNYQAVLPAVSPDTHHAIALNLELLSGLYKAIDSENKGEKKGILTLLISKENKLDGIGVVSSNSSGIGILMPCQPFGGAGYPGAFEKFNAISGKAAPLSSDVAAVFEQEVEVAEAFKPVARETEAVPEVEDDSELMEEEENTGFVGADEAEQVEDEAWVA